MAGEDLLARYRTKRDFSKTPEPAGDIAADVSGRHRFTIQRHKASRLHYDLRLELEGVLKSWAIPKGPSMNPADKRLAVHTEDHPLQYLHFEGEIPEDQYGAGIMHVWDTGIYEPMDGETDDTEEALKKGYDKGDLKVTFYGEKIKGSFALVRTGREDNHWLLIKKKDGLEVKGTYDSEDYLSPAMALQQKAKSKKGRGNNDTLPKGGDPMPHDIKPMLATLHEGVFDSPDWLYEIKWDGYRAIAEISEEGVRLYSRNGNSFLKKFPLITDALHTLPGPLVVDGEIVVLDKEGRADFQALQNYDQTESPDLFYYLFDVLYYNGYDLRAFALKERKKLLAQLAARHERIRVSDHIEGQGTALLAMAGEKGLEGIIAKKADSPYRTGVRSKEWLKIKLVQETEALVVGYTEPSGSRKYFGSLLLAAYDQAGKLTYMGRVGSGFDDQRLKEIKEQLDALARKTSPLRPAPKIGQKTYWATPRLIAEVSYTERTAEGALRHPVFKGLRTDKAPEEVRLEAAAPEPEASSVADTLRNSKAYTGDIEGRELKLTNLQKVYWPGDREITKGGLLAYYASIAPYILPHLAGRPQSLHRFPEGINGQHFYHKDAGDIAPEWMDTFGVHSESANKEVCYLVIRDLPGLLYTVNLGCIALNPWLSRTDTPDHPDYCVIDLDPSDTNDFEEVIAVARTIYDILKKAGVPSYPKTSGSTGIHILLPLGGAYTYEQSRNFAQIICLLAHHLHPDITSLERSPSRRKGKIYLDYMQNKKGATLASVYAVRPKPLAPVSTPLHWHEVKPGLRITDFTIHNLPARLRQTGDLFQPLLTQTMDMEKAIDRLGSAE